MKKMGNIRIIGMVAVVAIFVFIISSSQAENSFQFSAASYSSAFEGPKAQFLGVTYNNKEYTSANGNGASRHIFDTGMTFDADASGSGKPQINGQMTAVFLPEDSLSSAPAWVPFSWLQDNGLITQDSQEGIVGYGGSNPPWNWTIGNDTYQMKEFDMRYYVSFQSSWSGSEDPKGDIPDPILGGGGTAENTYKDVSVWLHFDISPTWYIAGGGVAYFAIAELTLAEDVQMHAIDNNNNVQTVRSDESVNPQAQQAAVSLYYGVFGTASSPSGTPEQYQGHDLNPAYFTKDLYAHIDLTNFGVGAGQVNFFGTYTRGDVATFAFDMKVFVIGEYKVQDIQKNPSQFGFTSPSLNTGVTWLTGIVGWLSSPANVGLLMGLIVLVLLIVFAPWVLLVIVSLFAGGKKR